MQTELQNIIRKISNAISDRRPVPDPLAGLRGWGQNLTFSEHDHVAYQIKGKHECSNMLANILPAEPRSPHPLTQGSKRQNSTFAEHFRLHIK